MSFATQNRRRSGTVFGTILAVVLAVLGSFPAQGDPTEAQIEAALFPLAPGYLSLKPNPDGVTDIILAEHYYQKAEEAVTNANWTLWPLSKRRSYVEMNHLVMLNFTNALAQQHMPAAYPVFGGDADNLWTYVNWVSTNGSNHVTGPGADNVVTGVCRYVIAHNARLRQQVKVLAGVTEIRVTFRVPLVRHWTTPSHYALRQDCVVYWGGTPPVADTENPRMSYEGGGAGWKKLTYYGGPLPAVGQWATLEVPAVDLGLGGFWRMFFSVAFESLGGLAEWGATEFCRSDVELATSKALGIFNWGEALDLEASLHNTTASAQTYQLAADVYDFEGNIVFSNRQTVASVPAAVSTNLPLNIPSGVYESGGVPFRSHFTARATASRPGATSTVQTSFGYIKPNQTGKKADSPFGIMIWEDPGTPEATRLAWDAGAKFFSMNESQSIGSRHPVFSAFTNHGMVLHARNWDIAFENYTNAPGPNNSNNPLYPALANKVAAHADAWRFLSPIGWDTRPWSVGPETCGVNMPYVEHAVAAGSANVEVGLAGIMWWSLAFADIFLNEGGAGHADFIAFQSYFTPDIPEHVGLFGEMKAMEEMFTRRGAGDCDVWLVEWYYDDHPNQIRWDMWVTDSTFINNAVSRPELAGITIRQHIAALAAGADRFLPGHVFKTWNTPLKLVRGHGRFTYLSHRADNSPLPMYFSYSAMTRNLEGKTFSGMLDCGPGVYCTRFDAFDASYSTLGTAPSVLALWSDYNARPVSLLVGQASVDVIDFVGNTKAYDTISNIVTLAATTEPLYVQLSSTSTPAACVDSPLLSSPDFELTAVYGIEAQRTATVTVTNPTDTSLAGTLAFTGPNWCSSSPGSAAVALDPHTSDTFDFTVTIPADNRDRVNYEFAGLVPRAGHQLAFDLTLSGSVNPVGQTRIPLVVEEPVDVLLRPKLLTMADWDAPKLLVTVKNRTQQTQTGDIDIRHESCWTVTPVTVDTFSVGPGQEVERQFQIAVDAPNDPIRDYGDCYYTWYFAGCEGYVAEALVQCDGGDENRQCGGFAFFPSLFADSPITIDGNTNEWAHAAWMDITAFGHGGNGRLEDWQSHGGDSDLSARWSTMWNASHFYICYSVRDDVFYQPYTNADLIFNGDSVRLNIDTRPDSTDAGIQPRGRDPHTVPCFDIALTPQGSRIHQRYDACGRRPGLLSAAQIQIVRSGNHTTYEMAIPWPELGDLRPEAGGWTHMSFTLDDNDGDYFSGYGGNSGAARKNRLTWFKGYHINATEPRMMGDVHFVMDTSTVYVVTSSAGTGGTVTPAATNTFAGGSVTFRVRADSKYHIASIATNDTPVYAASPTEGADVNATNYTWHAVDGDGSLTVMFARDPGVVVQVMSSL